MIDQRLNLYKHNLEGYGKVRNAYETGEDIVGIVHATGTGKTVLALQLCLDNPDKKTLFVAPSNAIIEHVLELIEECGLSKEKDFPNLEFCTYQSLTTKSDEELASLDIDLLVLDEFHHIGAPVWGEKIDTIINTHENMKIFGMTAYTVRDRGTIYERDMALPDGDELFSDKIVSRYDLVDAMCDGVLPIPNYKSAYLLLMEDALELEQEILNSKKMSQEDKNEYLRIIRDCKKQIDKAPTAKDLIKQNLQQGNKCIYFCPLGDGVILKDDEILGTNDVSSIRRRIGNLALEVSNSTILYETTSDIGESGKLNRDHFYNDTSFFRNEDVSDILRIMFAKNQYNEGVHAPGVTKVFLSRPTNSDIVFFEQIGRVLSTKGNIIELTKIYENKTIEELREIANKQGINIALCESKEEIIERLLAPTIIDLVGNISFIKQLKDNLQRRIKERQERGIPTKITQKLVEASFDIEVANENLCEILCDIQNKVAGLTWEEWYEAATAYYKEKGYLNISHSYVTETGLKLGTWIHNQRVAYKKNILSTEQINKLEAIGMMWKPFDEKWNKLYEQAKAYYKEKGHLNIPHSYVTETGLKLGLWIERQRKVYKEQKLILTKIEKLNAIGMMWEPFDEKWYEMYEQSKVYYEEKGHLNIPNRYVTETGLKLGNWIHNQRAAYKKKKLKLIKIEKLNAIGMMWEPFKEKWHEMYEQAKAYYDKNSHLNVPQSYVTETGLKLGSWINIQRKAYKKKKLTTNQIDKLESIGIVWEVNNEQLTWKEWYELAKAYYDKNRHLNIPHSYVTETGLNLGTWIYRQRQAYKEKKLTTTQIDKLESIGMQWRLKHKQLTWEEWYELAKTYYEENNNLNVLQRYVTEAELKLGSWINNQRAAYKKNILSPEQINKLEAIGMVWNTRSNNSDIELLCNEYSIDYKLNKKYVGKLSFSIFKALLMYLIDNSINYVDTNGMLISDFYMSSKDFENKYGISYQGLISKEKRR